MQHRAPSHGRGRHRRPAPLRGDHTLTTPAPAATTDPAMPPADRAPAQPSTLTTARPATHRAVEPAQTGPEAFGGHTDAARAYLDLLASTAPLTPADLLQRPATSPTDLLHHPGTSSADLRAYRDLLASGDKLSPSGAAPKPGDPAPRRRDVHSHRAPARPIAPALLGERGRYAVAAAAIAAGVGVAGVAAATAHPGRADAVAARFTSHTEPAPRTSPSPVSTERAPAIENTAGTAAVQAYAATAGTPTAEPVPGAAAPVRAAVRTARKDRPVPVVQWVDPMPGATTTSCFGPRWGRLHAGVDLAAPHGTPIVAAGAGTVVTAGEAQGYGIAVLIDHGNGYLTHYGHMSALTVAAGQEVAAGEQIGNEGSTGHSTGPHLHFEVHEGTYQNPIEPTAWMHEHGVDIGGCGQD